MKKIKSQRILKGIIITGFCCSFLFFIPITITSQFVNSNLISTKDPMASTESGSSNPTGDEWPMFHRSLNHTGVAETTPVGTESPIWNYTTGNAIVWSTPAVVSERVYVGSYDNNIYCLNASTGAKIWNYTTGSNIDSSPAVANGMVYIGSNGGVIYCLNALSGAYIWSYTTNGEIFSSPAVVNGKVYVGSLDDNVYCLNAMNGAQIWSYDTNGPIYSSPAVVNGMLYIGSENGYIYCLNASTGDKIWSNIAFDDFFSDPVVANGMVYIGSDNGIIYCLNAMKGTQIWNYSNSGMMSYNLAIANGMIYFGGDNSYLNCLNASTGDKIWNSSTPHYIYSSPAVANGMVYASSTNNNNVLCFNASTGAEIWNYNTWGQILSSPAIANGMVYIGSQNGKVYCLPMIFCTIPSAPLNLALNPDNWQVSLLWNAPLDNGGSPPTGYNIYRGNSLGTETLYSTVGNVISFTDKNVKPSTTYFYEVSAINPAGEGPRSSESSITTPLFVPTVPLNLQATSGNKNSTLSWQIPSEDGGLTIIGYNIYRGNSSGTESLLITVGGNILTFIDDGLTGGQTYYYEVSAINTAGEGSKTNEVNTLPKGIPFAPLNLNANPRNNNITLTWQAPSNKGGLPIIGYNIYRGDSLRKEALLITVGGNILTFTDVGLTGGQTYYYEVSAINPMGEGPKTKEVNALPTGIPSSPLNLHATPENTNITLTWQIPSNTGGLIITGYEIYEGKSSGSEILLAQTDANTLTYTDINLTPNTTYYYQISAVNSAGVGQKSSEINATTLTSNPNNKIGGTDIESLLLVSFIGVIVVVLGVKKRMNNQFIQ